MCPNKINLISFKIFSTVIILTSLCSCYNNKENDNKIFSNNIELEQMVIKDQQIRTIDNKDFDLESIDKTHREKVMELLANGLIRTAKDKMNAALILQHTSLTYCQEKLTSVSPENYLLAFKLSKSAFDSGNKEAAYYVAITFDRYLLYTKGFQKYGTQRVFDDQANEELWAPIDPMTTDDERAKYNVPKLDSLLKKYKMTPFVKTEK